MWQTKENAIRNWQIKGNVILNLSMTDPKKKKSIWNLNVTDQGECYLNWNMTD